MIERTIELGETLYRTLRDLLEGAPDEPIESPGDRYLDIVAPVNEVLALFNSTSDAEVKGKVLAALSLVLSDVAGELDGADWPVYVQTEAADLVAATESTMAAAHSLVSDPTEDAAELFARRVDTMADASAAMRTVLGLPRPGYRFAPSSILTG